MTSAGTSGTPRKIKDDEQLKKKRPRRKGERNFGETRERGVWMRICVWMGARYRTERSYWYFSVFVFIIIGADSADLP